MNRSISPSLDTASMNLTTATCPSELDGLYPLLNIKALAAPSMAVYETVRDQSYSSLSSRVGRVQVSPSLRECLLDNPFIGADLTDDPPP